MKSARNIIASVDLIGGKVVRLKQGDYARKTEYAVDPFEQLSRYVSDGSEIWTVREIPRKGKPRSLPIWLQDFPFRYKRAAAFVYKTILSRFWMPGWTKLLSARPV